jgi:hypothetical protein
MHPSHQIPYEQLRSSNNLWTSLLIKLQFMTMIFSKIKWYQQFLEITQIVKLIRQAPRNFKSCLVTDLGAGDVKIDSGQLVACVEVPQQHVHTDRFSLGGAEVLLYVTW